MRLRTLCLAFAFISGVAADAHPGEANESIVRRPCDIVFKRALVNSDPKTAILYGDPSKPGLYVMRVMFPAGYKLMPLRHSDKWLSAVVVSGTYYFGVGEQWDENKLAPYPAGTFYLSQPKTPHFAWAKDGEVIVQYTGMGPSRTTPIPQIVTMPDWWKQIEE